MRLLVTLLFLAVILVSGCTQQPNKTSAAPAAQQEDVTTLAKGACISYCLSLLSSGANLNNGPCLLNPIPDTDWVCDVAHSPRADVDNIPENQCSSYGTAAKHFVEVAPSCEFIKAV